MIGQITPLVQAAGKRNWIAVVASHAAGATLSASALGFVLGTWGLAIGLERSDARLGAVGGAVLLACALRDAGIWQWPVPSLHRQTPVWFPSAFGRLWGVFAWGLDLGQGWTTYITFTGYYGLVLWALVGANPIQGAAVLGAYGLGRALPVLAAGFIGSGTDLDALPPLNLLFLQKVNATMLAVIAGYFLSR